MSSASLYVMLALMFVACDSERESAPGKEPESPAADPRTDLLVGTWRLGSEREYTFSADGKFSMATDTSKCGGVAPTKSTAAGTWQLEGDSLVLSVTEASEEIFRAISPVPSAE